MNRLAVPIGRLASRKRAVMMMGAMTATRQNTLVWGW
jgi:hypothetical protein